MRAPAAATYVGLRLAGGLGPAVLGVSAAELRDRTPDLDELWRPAPARELSGRVGAAPAAALEQWLIGRAAECAVDPLGPPVQVMAAAGVAVASMAERLGLSARQLHRRWLAVFGYGPRRLARVLRLARALAAARDAPGLAGEAADCGYADQAHLAREVRALTGTTPPPGPGVARARAANRSTGVPSGSCTTAYRMPQNASHGGRWPW